MGINWDDYWDIADWHGPTPNCGDGDQYPNEGDDKMRETRGLVVHIAQGYYYGTIGYQKDPANPVSSHFVLAGPRDKPYGAPDGKLAQVVPMSIAAWTQRAGNGHWHSIECSGFAPGDALSPAQCETIATVYARGMREYGWPAQLAGDPDGRGLGYHSMGTPSNGWTGPTWGHEDCPGDKIIAQLPGILSRAVEINGGSMMLTDKQQTQMWARSVNAAEILSAMAKGLDAVPAGKMYDDNGDKITDPYPISGLYTRIAIAVNNPQSSTVPDHEHTPGGVIRSE